MGTMDGKPDSVSDQLYRRMVEGGESFWEVVKKPYMARDLNREQVRKFISLVLQRVQNFKELSTLFNISDNDYRKFRDFLRHNHLYPSEEI